MYYPTRIKSHISKYLRCLLLPTALLASVTQTTQAQTPSLHPFGGTLKFITGLNEGWFNGNYGSDLGENPVYETAAGYDPNVAEHVLTDCNTMHVNVLRIWINEGFQGVTFSGGNATGYTQTFQNNLDDLVTRANRHGIGLYLTFLTTYDLNPQSGWVGGTVTNPIADSNARAAYVNNVIAPIAQRYANNDAVQMFDLLNESNAGRDSGWYSWDDLRAYMSAATAVIHNASPNYQVSCSETGFTGFYADGTLQGTYGGVGLDFYDHHEYNDNGFQLPYTSSLYLDRPLLLGEFGAGSSGINPNTGRNYNQDAMDGYYQQAANGGWAGAMYWAYDSDGDRNRWAASLSDSISQNGYTWQYWCEQAGN